VDVLPRLRSVLLQRPRTLPGALSNAVENLGLRGMDFVHRLGELAPQIATPDDLLGIGAVLAWRLGDARLRVTALDAATRPSPALALAVLGLSGQGEEAAATLFARLAENAWSIPGGTLADAGEGWQVAGKVGGFAGFDGHFEEPPILLTSDDAT